MAKAPKNEDAAEKAKLISRINRLFDGGSKSEAVALAAQLEEEERPAAVEAHRIAMGG